jgi:hypothetical protein
MASYISMLVQSQALESVEVYFLVVGHTHSSIDQYFSVLSNAIHQCEFIGECKSWMYYCCFVMMNIWAGTPLALQWCVEHAHSKALKRPILTKQIYVRDALNYCYWVWWCCDLEDNKEKYCVFLSIQYHILFECFQWFHLCRLCTMWRMHCFLT